MQTVSLNTGRASLVFMLIATARYRLAPQFPFPCGLHDCLSAYLYLLSVHDPSEILLAGDSAGGGMVLRYANVVCYNAVKPLICMAVC